MGCCFGGKNNKNEPLLPKSSFDYNTVTTKIQWQVHDNAGKRTLPKLPLNGNVANPSNKRSSAAGGGGATGNLQHALPSDIEQWKPALLKTPKIALKSPSSFSNKELLTLLKIYERYFDALRSADDVNDQNHNNTNTNTAGGPSSNDNSASVQQQQQQRVIMADETMLYRRYNLPAYQAFLSLYNWYEKDGKKGGQPEKLKRIQRFCEQHNLWWIPAQLVSFLMAYYDKSDGLYKPHDQVRSELDAREQYYLAQWHRLIALQHAVQQNVSCVHVNNHDLYYKIYYARDYASHSQRTPLILIGECGQLKEDWLKLPELLSASRTVITFDMRGVGQTGHARSSASVQSCYSVDLLASDIAALLQHITAPQQKVFVLGNGQIGGVVAMTLSVRFQHLVAGLVLCATLHPSNRGPINPYVKKYNEKIITNPDFRAILKNNDNAADHTVVGCVESVTLMSNEEQDEKEGVHDGGGSTSGDCWKSIIANDKQLSQRAFFHAEFGPSSKEYKQYSYIMETQIGNKQHPFQLNTIHGMLPSSLLHRPSEGIQAQQNGYLKVLTTKNNVISSRIKDIKQATLLLHGTRDYVVTAQQTEFLSGKLINVSSKQMSALPDAGHLWWLTHTKAAVQYIEPFLFEVERQLSTQYDICVEQVICKKLSPLQLEQYTIVITSPSFIADEQQRFQQQYELSNLDDGVYPLRCHFLCIVSDVQHKVVQFKLLNKQGRLVGIAQCTLTEAHNASLTVDIVQVSDDEDADDDDKTGGRGDSNEVWLQLQIKHGCNRQEFKKKSTHHLPGINSTHLAVQHTNDDSYNRLDSADLDDLDI